MEPWLIEGDETICLSACDSAPSAPIALKRAATLISRRCDGESFGGQSRSGSMSSANSAWAQARFTLAYQHLARRSRGKLEGRDSL